MTVLLFSFFLFFFLKSQGDLACFQITASFHGSYAVAGNINVIALLLAVESSRAHAAAEGETCCLGNAAI